MKARQVLAGEELLAQRVWAAQVWEGEGSCRERLLSWLPAILVLEEEEEED